MAIFKPGTTITTREATITVDAGLPAGKYRFQLVVEGEKGGLSEPVESIVEVTGERAPIEEKVLVQSPLSPLPDRTAAATTTTATTTTPTTKTATSPFSPVSPVSPVVPLRTAPAAAPRVAPAATPIATPLAPLRTAPATTPLASPIRPGIRLPPR